MIYRIVLSSNVSVPIENEQDLQKFMVAASTPNQKLIMTKHGVVNPSFIVAIVPYDEKNKEMVERWRAERQNRLVAGDPDPRPDQAKLASETLGVSPFSRILAGKMPQLTPEERTSAQEESARRDRKLKK